MSSTVFLTSSRRSDLKVSSLNVTMGSGMVFLQSDRIQPTRIIPGRAVPSSLSGRYSAVKVRKKLYVTPNALRAASPGRQSKRLLNASRGNVNDWVYKVFCQETSEGKRTGSVGAIGKLAMDRILDVTSELEACVRDRFKPHEGVYRLNDSGEYVSEDDWLNVWESRPRGGRKPGCLRTTVNTRLLRLPL